MDPRRFFAVLERAEVVGRTFTGHAAVFGSLAQISGHWETISRSAFDSSLERQDDAILSVNHDASRLLARTSSGTLRLSVDDIGLKVEADIADTSDGRDVLTLLERGDLNGMSFAGLVVPGSDTWDTAPDGRQRNTITDFARLVDVSIVARPAYPDTDAILRSVDFANVPRINGREQLVHARARASASTRKAMAQ